MIHFGWEKLVLGSLLFFVNTGCDSPSTEDNAANLALISVTTAPVIRVDMADTVSIFGTLHLRQEARVASQFDGRLGDFSLLPGDQVREGQRIGTIIPQAREALLQVIDDMPASARPGLEMQIRTIQLNSPIAGIVLEVMRHTGDVVQKGEQIVHLGDLSELDIRGDLPLRYLPLVRKNRNLIAAFVDYPHAPLALPLQAISGQISEGNQTAMIRLRLDNPRGEFRPGMLVRLSFPGERHTGALTIPRPALLEEEGVYSVFVLKDNRVEQREVRPGILQNSRVEILEGVLEHELVVTEKAYSLEDGMEVLAR